MIALCPRCHDDMCHTKKKRKEHLLILQNRYGYEYEGQPWTRILGV